MPRHSAHRACNDFHATAQRTRYLQAPLTRRQLIGRGVGAGLAVYAAKAMPVARMFEAAAARAAAAPNAPILVSVFLPGGCDLLGTIAPMNQYGPYADLRPTLKLGSDATPIANGDLALHASLTSGTGGGIKGLFDAGKIGLLPGIDYANPDLSHFHSRHFWETGLITEEAASGWLGRWLDSHGSSDNPLQGITLDSTLSPVMRASVSPVAAVASPNDAQFWIPDVWGNAFDSAMDTWGNLAAPSGAPGPQAAAGAVRMSRGVAARLKPYTHDDNKPDPLAGQVAYPSDNDLGDRLKALAGMLSAPLGIRLAAVDADGDFDTHDNEPAELGAALGKVSDALSAYQADLEQRGLADHVLTLVWSEFGRRPRENDSSGTDHGAGGIAWVQGRRVQGGVLTDFPDLTQLDQEDNLAVTVDFRRVYSSLLEQWLGTDASEVIPRAGDFGRVQLIR